MPIFWAPIAPSLSSLHLTLSSYFSSQRPVLFLTCLPVCSAGSDSSQGLEQATRLCLAARLGPGFSRHALDALCWPSMGTAPEWLEVMFSRPIFSLPSLFLPLFPKHCALEILVHHTQPPCPQMALRTILPFLLLLKSPYSQSTVLTHLLIAFYLGLEV